MKAVQSNKNINFHTETLNTLPEEKTQDELAVSAFSEQERGRLHKLLEIFIAVDKQLKKNGKNN